MSEDRLQAGLARAVRAHALGWLIAANAAGLLLAAFLIWPEAAGDAALLSYGRWMPVHLNGQLYGWCALPLVGALLAACLEPRHPAAGTHARWALRAWSAALAFGVAAWLGGLTSGKLFLDWAGWARPALGVAMSVLWTLLAAHLWWSRARAGTARWRVAAGLMAGLTAVPALMYWSAGREVYPAVNPDSGGATGASLLGSTLGIVFVFGLLPVLLGVKRREGRRTAWFWWALAGSFAAYGAIDHGHASHHAAGQIVGLGLLLAWVPLLWIYGYGWEWNGGSRRWAAAAGAWWVLLVASGWITFLPGVSEAWKFTHALVAHAHLAMAGLVTAVNFVVLNELDPARPLGGRGMFWTWQTGCAVHVGLMMALGALEARHAAELFYGTDWTRWIFVGRLGAGVAMAFAAGWAWIEVFSAHDTDKPVREMKPLKTMKLARGLALVAGGTDAATGLGLVVAPGLTLAAMQVAAPGAEALVFLRWVGAFVGAVGASYLVALARGGAARLREVFSMTLLFRAAAGGYCAVAVATGALEPRWITVALTDGALALAQVWLLRRGGWDHE